MYIFNKCPIFGQGLGGSLHACLELVAFVTIIQKKTVFQLDDPFNPNLILNNNPAGLSKFKNKTTQNHKLAKSLTISVVECTTCSS